MKKFFEKFFNKEEKPNKKKSNLERLLIMNRRLLEFKK